MSSRLQRPSRERRRERRAPLGAHGEVVVEHDALAVEEERSGRRVRVIQQLVDERDEALPEASGGVVPLAVPVRVRDDADVQRPLARLGGGRFEEVSATPGGFGG